MSYAPTLTTARLTLRGHRIDDLDALTVMWADPAVYAFIGGKPRSREDVWLRLLRSIGQWTAFGYGAWVVERDGQIIGDIGLLEARRAIEPVIDDAPELGWALAGAAHGQGYAREALAVVLGWADAQGLERTCCIIDAGNSASIRLGERMGYALRTTGRYHDEPIGIYDRMAGAGAIG